MYLYYFLILLCGCAYFKQESSEKILKKGWAKTPKYKKKPFYCYKTLGEVMCYKTPLYGQEYRLISPQYVYEYDGKFSIQNPINPNTF